MKLTENEAEEMMARLVESTVKMITPPTSVLDHMTRNVITVLPTWTMAETEGPTGRRRIRAASQDDSLARRPYCGIQRRL